MDNLFRHLASLSADPFDCIVHIGAGADADSADYAALNPKHIVLIEADPEAHAALAERFADAPDVDVLQALVAPQKEDTTFHRLTLPSFNSPLGLGRLRELYPRIKSVEKLHIQGQVLNQLVGQQTLGARNLLILDIPGQEAAALRTLADEFLDRFTSIVVHASAESWQEGAEPLGTTLAMLKAKHFELAHEVGEDPAWPCVLLMRDAAKAAMQQELDKRAQLLVAKATQIHQQTEQINALTAERDDLVTRHQQLATEREALQSDHSSLSTLHSSLIAERDDLATRHSSLVTALDEIQGQHSSLVAERDDLVIRFSALESEHSELVTRHSSLVTESEALHSDLSAKSTLLDVLTKGRIAQDEQMEKLLQEQKTLVSERDALASRVSDLISQVEKLEAHAKLIDEEFGKAEGQIELIKDIFLREAIR